MKFSVSDVQQRVASIMKKVQTEDKEVVLHVGGNKKAPMSKENIYVESVNNTVASIMSGENIANSYWGSLTEDDQSVMPENDQPAPEGCPYSDLIAMIDSGAEFPDAIAKVALKHRLGDEEVQALKDKYDASEAAPMIEPEGEPEMEMDIPFHIDAALESLLRVAESFEEKEPSITEGIVNLILPGLEKFTEDEEPEPVDPTMPVDTTGADDEDDDEDDDVDEESEDASADHIEKSIKSLSKIMNMADDDIKDDIEKTIDHLQKAKDLLDKEGDEDGEDDEDVGNVESGKEEGENPYPSNPPADVDEKPHPTNPNQVIGEIPG